MGKRKEFFARLRRQSAAIESPPSAWRDRGGRRGERRRPGKNAATVLAPRDARAEKGDGTKLPGRGGARAQDSPTTNVRGPQKRTSNAPSDEKEERKLADREKRWGSHASSYFGPAYY